MNCYVAVDVGGTSTRAMVLDDAGRCSGTGRGGRGNPISDGTEAASVSIRAAIEQALLVAAVSGDQVSSVTLAMAGATSWAETMWLRAPLDSLGIGADFGIEADLLGLFFAGTHLSEGYALVAGTGATGIRVREGEVEVVNDGLGWLLDDTGSGFWIGREVARAVARALDHRQPHTSMVLPVLELLQVDPDLSLEYGRAVALHDLVRRTYAQSPLALAALAPIAFADPEDEVSANIVGAATTALASTVIDLYDPTLPGPLVLGGGVLASQPRLYADLVRALREAGVNADLLPVKDGLVGAGVLALRRAGIAVDSTIFDRISASTTQALSAQFG